MKQGKIFEIKAEDLQKKKTIEFLIPNLIR